MEITPPHVAARTEGAPAQSVFRAIPAPGEPGPTPPPPPGKLHPTLLHLIDRLANRTAFDGDDYSSRNPSFDIHGGAERILEKYDRNGDGAINVNEASILGETNYTANDHMLSIAPLAQYADTAGDGDGQATAAEIAAVITRFDETSAGSPGRLSGDERERFLRVFDEETTHVFPYRPTGTAPDRN